MPYRERSAELGHAPWIWFQAACPRHVIEPHITKALQGGNPTPISSQGIIISGAGLQGGWSSMQKDLALLNLSWGIAAIITLLGTSAHELKGSG